MNLWLRAPFCEGCIQREWWWKGGPPEIQGQDWAYQLGDYLSESRLREINTCAATGEDPAGVPCHRCGGNIRPWEGDSLFVVKYHVEEHYGILTETPNHVQPGKTLTREVMIAYGRQCFRCGARERLHIDHIMPRPPKTGDAAFRNLQPLCRECGSLKADQMPDEVTVYSDHLFERSPSDACEGPAWWDTGGVGPWEPEP